MQPNVFKLISCVTTKINRALLSSHHHTSPYPLSNLEVLINVFYTVKVILLPVENLQLAMI